MSETDLQLLARYTRKQAEDAFAEIVRRHLDLVHSAALRQVRSPQLAEEVAQSVFIDLARKAHGLPPNTILTAWLYRVARRTAIDVVRGEARRQLREQIATELNVMNSPSADWTHIESLLDEAMDALDDTDRIAVLLRYFENKSLREVGAALGTSDDAAQKRVSRAVERLREFLTKRGISVGASGLAGFISAKAVQAAPVGLAATISTAAGLGTLRISTFARRGFATSFFGLLLQVSRTKLGASLAAAVIVGLATYITFRSLHQTDSGAVSETLKTSATLPEQTELARGPASQNATVAGDPRKPDPLQLLLGVAQARQRIVSGSLEFQLTTERFPSRRRETNQLRLVALFDGPKLRYEQFGREYSYTYSPDEAQQAEISKSADSMDRESAVRAGLLKPFESHHVTSCDGEVLVNYWETDGKPPGTTIDNPGKGTGQFIFDPRCLGLTTSVSVGNTIEKCLGINEAKSIDLVGEESVEGIPAWRVQVRTKHDENLEFWIEVAHPEHLLKHARGSDVAMSQYDDADLRDPVPTEVTTMNLRNGSPLFGQRFIRFNSRFNVPIDPASFTLAGLGMQVGTTVSDNRNHRRIGYWTGSGLSKDLPPDKAPEPQSPPKLAELVTSLEVDPVSTEALATATWILLNTPDGSEVEKAAEVILREHTRDSNLVKLCQELARVRHRCSKGLLEAILKDNPNVEIRATACFGLATLLKDEAKFGQNKKATVAAEKHFERVIAEFGQVQQQGRKLADLAQPELSELRRLTLGQPAPEIEGEDLDGQSMKLSEYRGKVVVLVFWWLGYSEAPGHRKLVERFADKPFALVGVYGEDDLTKGKAEVEKYGMTWPSFWDKRDGPISKTWNVESWPNIWVLDHQGVIRYRGVRGRELNDAVDALIRESR